MRPIPLLVLTAGACSSATPPPPSSAPAAGRVVMEYGFRRFAFQNSFGYLLNGSSCINNIFENNRARYESNNSLQTEGKEKKESKNNANNFVAYQKQNNIQRKQSF